MLTKVRLLAYGSLALPLSLAEIPILLYLPAFYAKEVGLSSALVGLAFLSARLWDGVIDLLIGWLSDRYRFRWGTRKPWVLAGAPFLMISTWFLCNPPGNVGLLYLAVWAPLFYAADAVVKIPYLSWGAELSTDYGERSRVAAFREMFSMLGTLFFVSAPLVLLPKNAPLSSVLFLVSIAVLAIVPLAAAMLGWFVRDASQPAPARVPLFKGLASLSKDRVLAVFSSAMLLYYVACGVINSLAVFSFGVGLQLQDKLFWVIFVLYASTLCAVPVVLSAIRHGEKHRLLALSLLILMGTYVAHLFIPRANFAIVAGLWAIGGLANAAVLILPTSILADIIDHGDVTTGERRAGAYMAVFNLVKKIGLALGVGVAFGLLQVVGYEAHAVEHSVADQFNIRLLGFVLPGLLLLPAMILVWKHPITRQAQGQLRAAISARMTQSSTVGDES